jgi:biopolymer transport protein ExbD
MLVLLVVFMITAPLLTASLPVELPAADGTPVAAVDRSVSVTITADGHTFVDGVDVGSDLDSAIATARASGVMTAVVRADRATAYDAVARAVAAVRDAGIGRVELVVDPEPR